MNEQNTFYTDMRAVIMEKCAPGEQPQITVPPDFWLTLGHLDWLRIKTLSCRQNVCTGACLDRVMQLHKELSASRRTDSTYSQPLYILREFTWDQGEAVHNFWSTPSAFMVIVRVHSKGQGQNQFERAVDRQFSHVTEIFSYDRFTFGTKLDKKVLYLYYRSLELSDIVLIAKSDSIESLLNSIGYLYTMPEAGDIYSYYCIHPEALESSKRIAVAGDCIPLISTRFAVRSAMSCRNLIGRLGDLFSNNPAFFVSGVEDINIIAYERSSAQLCDIFRGILSMGGKFWEAFGACTTRLGIYERTLTFTTAPEIGSGEFGKKTDLSGAYQLLRREFFDFCKLKVDRDWMSPLRELLNMLTNISSRCELRQLCYILLPGMRGLVQRAQLWSEACHPTEWENAEISSMIQGVTYLIEHIIRMEGELVHHPETRPPLFDIPANLLEFYLGFSDRCAEYFQRGEARRRFYLLLIPQLCEYISIHDRLHPQDGQDHLLFVEIPLALIYNPFDVICSLVHEVAHHSGEATRQREDRFISLLKCGSFILADELEMVDSDTVFLRIYQEMEARYPRDKKKYMRDIEIALLETIAGVYQTDIFIESLWSIYLDEKSGTSPTARLEWLNSHSAAYEESRIGQYSLRFHRILWEVENLFKETYADLAMMMLLDLTASEYIGLMEDVERPPWDDNKITFSCRIERMGLVLSAVGGEKRLELARCAEEKPGEKNLASYVDAYCQVLEEQKGPEELPKGQGSEDEDGDEGYHSLEVAECILEYLKQCRETIENFGRDRSDKEELERIRRDFRRFAKECRLASPEFFETIENYRPQIIRHAIGAFRHSDG